MEHCQKTEYSLAFCNCHPVGNLKLPNNDAAELFEGDRKIARKTLLTLEKQVLLTKCLAYSKNFSFAYTKIHKLAIVLRLCVIKFFGDDSLKINFTLKK